MPIYYCTGCRAELDADFLRDDRDGYWWCEACKPKLHLTSRPPRR